MEKSQQIGKAESDQSDRSFDENTPVVDYAPAYVEMNSDIQSDNALINLTYEQLQEMANTIVDLHESMTNPDYWEAFKKSFSKKREKRQETLHHAAVNCFMSLEAKYKADKKNRE